MLGFGFGVSFEGMSRIIGCDMVCGIALEDDLTSKGSWVVEDTVVSVGLVFSFDCAYDPTI